MDIDFERMSLSKRILVYSALFVCVVIVARLVFPPREAKVAVQFAGYTNDSRGTRLARLRVVNEGNVTVWRWGMYWHETDEQSGLNLTQYYALGRNVRLLPDQSEVVAIPAITNQGAWRVVLNCPEYGFKIKLQDWMGPLKLSGPAWRFSLYRWCRTPNHFIRSEWIEEREHVAQRTTHDIGQTTRRE